MVDVEEENGEDKLNGVASSSGFFGKLEHKYREIKENAEKYPYVWGSYIVVYGGIFLWAGYRWRKLRKTEDRVRILQEKLRKHYEAQESSIKQSANSVDKTSTPSKQ
ncbi:uncharacterized protein LOC101213780 [Cucumis sativus]|uniref:uncharacterized protein LOC101213780 n=1 Tax=Cucumis sativus TaxID=3659 RepID=UPI0002B4C130|nr:uncharacterized protein LOC101213780 [Cucumis sativus]KAE8651990.1 hypothetical protein Csa_016946 [Cucumis sativus]